jgi:hypothetical protein
MNGNAYTQEQKKNKIQHLGEQFVNKTFTWWEHLGLTKEQAKILDPLLGPLPKGIPATEAGVLHPMCQNCGNRVDPKSFHDCCGVYDEIRYRLSDTLARSTKRRLMTKYQCEWEEVGKHVDAFFIKNAHRIPELTKEFERIRKNDIYRQKLLELNWDKDEELWNS